MELYSHSKYKGHSLFVECIPLDEDNFLYEGVAQINGITLFTSKSVSSGDIAEDKLKSQIDKAV